MIFFIFTLIILYAGFLSLIVAGIVKTGRKDANKALKELPFVNIIIPFRNEAENLAYLLDDLSLQKYPDNRMKIILVNDHSDDDSKEIAKQKITELKANIFIFDLPDTEKGKKSAISTGIKYANEDDLILSTDADCRFPESWVASMAVNFEKHNADILLGPVIMQGKTFIGLMQESESLSLLSVTMGFAGLGVPVLSNGANIMYRKSVVNEKDDPYKMNVDSGDDVFLMEYLKKNNKKIVFNDSPSAMVETDSNRNLRQLLQQRSRWLRKTKHYKFGLSKITAGFFAVLQMSFIFILILLIIQNEILLLLSVFLFKMVCDILVFLVSKYRFKIKTSMFYFAVFSLIYPLWTVMTSVLAYLIKPEWKGRKLAE